MYNYNDYRYYLAHHGILGQKWGKRNGPPYPIGSGGHSASEKKAGWRKSLGGGRNEHLYDRKKTSHQEVKKNTHESTLKTKNGSEKSKLNLTDKQKSNIKKGAIIASAVLGTAVGSYVLYKSGAANKLAKVGREYLNKGADPATGFKTLKKPLGDASRLVQCNQGTVIGNPGRMMNCGNTVLANECIHRGLDVTSRTNSTGMTIPQMAAYFKGVKKDTFLELHTSKAIPELDIFNPDLEKRGRLIKREFAAQIESAYPDGARGSMLFTKLDGSHWISWKIENGQTIFENPQYPLEDDWFNMDEMFGKYVEFTSHTVKGTGQTSAFTTCMRMDDLEINESTIKKAVRNRTDILSDYKKQGHNTYDEMGNNFVMINPHGLSEMKPEDPNSEWLKRRKHVLK